MTGRQAQATLVQGLIRLALQELERIKPGKFDADHNQLRKEAHVAYVTASRVLARELGS